MCVGRAEKQASNSKGPGTLQSHSKSLVPRGRCVEADPGNLFRDFVRGKKDGQRKIVQALAHIIISKVHKFRTFRGMGKVYSTGRLGLPR